ncbi:MAG: MFS transporter [Microbacteriaceae bacterium]|nr:MFS transporter [Microbacteriaceae bacterium]
MTIPRPSRLHLDTLVAVLGVVLVAMNTRTAVGGLSPIYDIINSDVALGIDARAVLGSLPPIAYVIGGLITPRITRLVGLEWNLVILLSLMTVGHVVRSAATDWFTIVAGSALVLIGSGMGNVSLPPVVKRYFPNAIGAMSSAYMTFVAIGSIVPALIAVPLSLGTSWRIALGAWVFLSLGALIPWLIEIRRGHRSTDTPIPQIRGERLRVHRSPTAWAIATTLVVSSTTGYGMFAWLPDIAKESALMNQAEGGLILALFAGAGLPVALGIPLLAAKIPNISALVFVGSGLTITGALGFALAPTVAPYLWAVVLGSGTLLFPLALVLINLRTASSGASLQVSAFAQFIAYSVSAVVVPLMGFSRAETGSWQLALVGIAIIGLAAMWSGTVLARNRTVESELAS